MASPTNPPPKTYIPECSECVIRVGLQGAGLSNESIQTLCRLLHLNQIRRRQVLFVAGNRATHFYALRSGRVKLTRAGTSGRQHIVNLLGSADLFGLEAAFGQTYSVSAEVLADGEVCVGSREELEQIANEAPAFGLDMARYLFGQLEDAWIQQGCLGTVGARPRLASYLIQQADTSTLEVASDLTLSELGSILGLSPETVCRTMSWLRSHCLIESQGSVTRIRDLDGLTQVAGG